MRESGSVMPVRVVLIAGLGRSGSTLIDRALGEPPECLSLGEVVRIWERGLVENAVCGCGEVFSACPFWGPVGGIAFGGWNQLDPQAALAMQRRVDRTRYIPLMVTGLGRRYQRLLRAYAERLSALYRAFAAHSGATFIIDSSKDLSTTFLLRRVPGIQLRVVHLVRDARAVAYSWTKHVTKPGASAEMDRYAPGIVGLRYMFNNLLISVLTVLGTPRRRLRYEDFVEAPGSSARDILGFAGLTNPDLGFVDDMNLHLSPHHSVGGNPMRMATGAVTVRLDDEWRDGLPTRDRRIVTAIAWPLLVAYGYLGSRRGTQ